jgi:ornithine--oxo-acid transaminase
MIAKPTHDNIIRFAPPLVVTDSQTDEMIEVVRRTWKQHNDD